ncbi:MAG: hypothetical protein ACLQPH_00170 [Acidimicrobiales bacterium]
MAGTDPDDDVTPPDEMTPPTGPWERMRAPFRRPHGDADKPSLSSRLSSAVLKPSEGAAAPDEGPTTVEELEEAVKRADDKERLIGLLAAPLAGMIALLVTGSLIANDPKATLANGHLNSAHVNPSVYLELGAVTLALAVAMLAAAWFRKRLYLGIIMALYGLSIFNLHFWGFGVPFLLAGAWYLVRAYRLQTKLKLAKESGPTAGRSPTGTARPSKRYTPPTAPPGKPPKTKPGDERKAG